MVSCPSCEKEYKQLSEHWRQSGCNYPEITERQWRILEGMMLGDARLVSKKNRIPYLELSNTKKEFLEWFDAEMGCMSTGVREHGKPLEDHHKQAYVCSTRTHPSFSYFNSWYKSGEKKPPYVELDRLKMMCWYCSDGCVNTSEKRRPTARLSSRKPDVVKQRMKKMIEDIGFNPTWSYSHLVFTADETERLFDWLGEPLPGFRYKFPEPPDLDRTYSAPSTKQWTDKETYYELRYEKEYSYRKMADLWDCSTATIHRWDRKHGFT